MIRFAIPTVLAIILVVSGGAVSAAETTAPSQRVVQVRLANLEAVEEVTGTATFELADRSGATQSHTQAFHAEAGEGLDEMAASFNYVGPFRWSIRVADDDDRQLTHLAGDYPGYPYSEVAPLSNRLRVVETAESVVFLDLISFMLEFDAIAVLRDQAGLKRVRASAGLDSDGSGVFDDGEVVSTVAKPEERLVRVTVPRLSSTVTVASFFYSLTDTDGQQLAYVEGTYSFDGGKSVAFDLDAREIGGITTFYGKPTPSQSISTISMPSPWHAKKVELASANDGADFSVLIGEEHHMVFDEINRTSPLQTAQALITVSNQEGMPVEGATIQVDGRTYVTDEFGQATVSASPGSHEMAITAEGLEPSVVSLEFVEGEDFSSRVALSDPKAPPLDRAEAFLSDHWLTMLFGLCAAGVLILIAVVILIPSSRPQRLISR